jgi:hypothetical protein
MVLVCTKLSAILSSSLLILRVRLSPPSSAEVKNGKVIFPLSPISSWIVAYMAKPTDTFTFNFYLCFLQKNPFL